MELVEGFCLVQFLIRTDCIKPNSLGCRQEFLRLIAMGVFGGKISICLGLNWFWSDWVIWVVSD